MRLSEPAWCCERVAGVARGRTLPVLASLPRRTTQGLLRQLSIERMPARAILFREGEAADSLCVLIEGLIQLFTIDGVRETTVLILRPNTWFATEAVFGDTPLLASGRVIRPSSIGRISAPVARRLFNADIEFAKAVAKNVQSTYRDVLSELKNLRAKTGLQRLAAWILAMERQSPIPGEIALPYGKALLAARLGMTAETLSRALAKLNRFGVAAHGRRLRIEDVSVLRQLASPDQPGVPPVP